MRKQTDIALIRHELSYKQADIALIRHELSYKQLEVKMNRTSFVCGNRRGHHNTELKT